MENQFFIDSKHLSSEALAKKHRLENDPTFRTNHMEYMEGMEIIDLMFTQRSLSKWNPMIIVNILPRM